MIWFKHHLKYIKRWLKRLFRIDWSVQDMNDHIKYMKWKKVDNRVNT